MQIFSFYLTTNLEIGKSGIIFPVFRWAILVGNSKHDPALILKQVRGGYIPETGHRAPIICRFVQSKEKDDCYLGKKLEVIINYYCCSSHCVAPAGFKFLVIVLFQALECWDYRYKPVGLVVTINFWNLRWLYWWHGTQRVYSFSDKPPLSCFAVWYEREVAVPVVLDLAILLAMSAQEASTYALKK